MAPIPSPIARPVLGILLATVVSATALRAQDALVNDGRPVAAQTESTGVRGYRTRIVLVNSPGHPSAASLATPLAVGGQAGIAFDRPSATRTGSRLSVAVRLDGAPADRDEALWVDGELAIREGDPIPGAAPSERFGPMPTRIGLDEAGRLLIAHRSVGVQPTGDDLLLRFDPSSVGPGFATTVLAREGGLAATLVPTLPLERWAGRFHSPSWLDGGGFAFGVEGLTGLGGAPTEPALVRDATILTRGGLAPAGATETWQRFDLDRFHALASGRWLAQGDLTGFVVFDDVVVVDGAVVARENATPIGSGLTESIDLGDSMRSALDPAGRSFVRGDLITSKTDFVLRDNVILARSRVGDEVVPGSGESWDDARFPACFFAMSGNTDGAFLIGGVTDASADSDGVLLLQGPSGERVVLCREGDPVDLDGNGLFDDDRFFNTFGDDDIVLLDDLSVLVVATLRDGSGATVDEGLFLLEPPSEVCETRNGSGVNPVGLFCVEPARLGRDAVFEIPYVPSTTLSTVQFASFPLAPLPTDFGELLIDLGQGFTTSIREATPGSPTTPARFVVPIPNRLSLLGLPFQLQGFRVDLVSGQIDARLLNALELVVGR